MSRRTLNSNATQSTSSTHKRDRFNASEVIKYYEKNGIIKKKRPPSIPKAANFGWNHLPVPAKIMILGVFSGAVSVTTPYWAYIKSDALGYATFGLWHFCSGQQCSSIHDNLVEGRSVETWYHLTQGSMCIGVALSIIGLAMLTNSIEGTRLRMTITVHWACACVLAISALEHLLGLYVFISYLPDISFLFDQQYTQYVDLYGSCYMAIISFISSLISAFMVFMDESIYQKKGKKVRNGGNGVGGNGVGGDGVGGNVGGYGDNVVGYGGKGGDSYGDVDGGGYTYIRGGGYGDVGGCDNYGVFYGEVFGGDYGAVGVNDGHFYNEGGDFNNGEYGADEYCYNYGYDDYMDDVVDGQVAASQPGYHGNRDGKVDHEI